MASKPWNNENLVAAFNAALRRSITDDAFRKRLLDRTAARDAVAEEGGVDIPEEVVIRFYERKTDTGDVFCVELPPAGDTTKPPKAFEDLVYCSYHTWA